jgi:sugar lactone lactonase YvrE
MGSTESPKPFYDKGIQFPEGPRWRDGRLWISDMFGERVLAISEDGEAEDIVAVPGRPSGLGWLPDGTLLIVCMEKRSILRLDSDGLAVHADLSGHIPAAPNDMLVDRQGRAYVGNLGFDFFGGAPPEPANLLLVTPAGEVRQVATDLLFPNGMAVTADGTTLLVAETFGHRLTGFTIEEDGSLTDRRVFAQLGEEHSPDGIALDADGNVWVSSALSGEYLLVREGGEILDTIKVPAMTPACALGGADGHTLFLLQAMTTLEGFAAGQSQGKIETVRVSSPAPAS